MLGSCACIEANYDDCPRNFHSPIETEIAKYIYRRVGYVREELPLARAAGTNVVCSGNRPGPRGVHVQNIPINRQSFFQSLISKIAE